MQAPIIHRKGSPKPYFTPRDSWNFRRVLDKFPVWLAVTCPKPALMLLFYHSNGASQGIPDDQLFPPHISHWHFTHMNAGVFSIRRVSPHELLAPHHPPWQIWGLSYRNHEHIRGPSILTIWTSSDQIVLQSFVISNCESLHRGGAEAATRANFWGEEIRH